MTIYYSSNRKLIRYPKGSRVIIIKEGKTDLKISRITRYAEEHFFK